MGLFFCLWNSGYLNIKRIICLWNGRYLNIKQIRTIWRYLKNNDMQIVEYPCSLYVEYMDTVSLWYIVIVGKRPEKGYTMAGDYKATAYVVGSNFTPTAEQEAEELRECGFNALYYVERTNAPQCAFDRIFFRDWGEVEAYFEDEEAYDDLQNGYAIIRELH